MKQWVNKDRTVLVRRLSTGVMEVATRPDTDAVWGPPMLVIEEPEPPPADPSKCRHCNGTGTYGDAQFGQWRCRYCAGTGKR